MSFPTVELSTEDRVGVPSDGLPMVSDDQTTDDFGNLRAAKKTRKSRSKNAFNITPDLPSELLRTQYKIVNLPSLTAKQTRALDNVHIARSNLWYPSKADLINRLITGELKNCNFTESDIKNYYTLFEKDLVDLKARAEHEIYSNPDLMDSINPLNNELVIRGDLMFVGGLCFLLTIAYPGAFAHCELIRGKEAHIIKPAILRILNYWKSRNYTPKILNFDSERGVIAISDDIESTGCILVTNPKGEKVPEAENLIKTIKQRIRAKLFTMPFQLGRTLLAHIVIGAVLHTNLIGKKTNIGQHSPYCLMFKRSVDYQQLCKFSPSDYVEVSVAATSNLTNKFRTISAIPLYPVLDKPSKWWFFSLETFRPFSRHVEAAHRLPMPASAIARLNALAESDPIPEFDPTLANLIFTDADGTELAADEIDPFIDPELPSNVTDDDMDQPSDCDDSDAGPGVNASDDTAPELEPEPPPNPYDISTYELPVIPSSSESLECDELISVNPNGTETRSVRTRKPNPKYYNQSYINTLYVESVGTYTYRNLTNYATNYSTQLSANKALEQFQHEGYDCIKKEIEGILDRQVFVGILRSSLTYNQQKKIIRSSMFVKEKLNSLGEHLKLKARLVAGGHMQDRSVYSSDQITSPTVATSSFFTVASIAAAERRHVMTFDIGQAYLNADMETEVIMSLDPLTASILVQIDPSYKQYLERNGAMLVRLTKALYGCVESAKLWYNHLKAVLLRLGYTVNPYDICVFNRTSASGKQSTVCFHVDDGFATSQDLEDLMKLKKELKAEFKIVEFNHGLVHEYLGMRLDFSKKFLVHISMEAYIERLISENRIKNTSRTPARNDLFVVNPDAEPLSKMLIHSFHKITAQLLYLGTRVRPDIMLAVNFLSSRVTCPSTDDAAKLKRVLQYLCGTPHLGLLLGGDNSGNVRLLTYVDASYAVHPESMKSHTGVFITLGRGPILVKSNKQKVVSKSSTEAELVALSEATSLSIAELLFLQSQGIDIKVELQQDNTSTIKLATNGRSSSDRTRHVNIRYFFVKQFLDSEEMIINHCPTADMIADILTKPLQGEHFLRLRDLLLGYQLPTV